MQRNLDLVSSISDFVVVSFVQFYVRNADQISAIRVLGVIRGFSERGKPLNTRSTRNQIRPNQDRNLVDSWFAVENRKLYED